MANFLEFLKSGKSAREFIDDAVLPQNVLSVTRAGTSPEAFGDAEIDNTSGSDVPAPDTGDLDGADADDQAQDIYDDTLLESEDDPDDEFMRKLEALENTMGDKG